jgi:hypothetical protein
VSARKQANPARPDSGAQLVVKPLAPRDELKDLAKLALGGGSPWKMGQVEQRLDALEVDLDVLHLAMVSPDCDAFAINNYVLRLISRVRVIRELHRVGGGA